MKPLLIETTQPSSLRQLSICNTIMAGYSGSVSHPTIQAKPRIFPDKVQNWTVCLGVNRRSSLFIWIDPCCPQLSKSWRVLSAAVNGLMLDLDSSGSKFMCLHTLEIQGSPPAREAAVRRGCDRAAAEQLAYSVCMRQCLALQCFCKGRPVLH